MSVSPLRFTGVSQFSEDFQAILERSVSIQSVPLKGMQNQQAELLARKELLTGLRTAAEDLGSAVAVLGAIGASRAATATSSDPDRVTVATASGGGQTGWHTVSHISSVAKAAAETTQTGWANADEDAVSTDGVMELLVGESTFVVDLTEAGRNNLAGLRDAINDLGAGVTATLVNTGTGATPYYLSISSNSTGERALQLRETAGEAGSNILTASNQGADAVFELDGFEVRKPENTIAGVVPGLSFTIRSQTVGEEQITIGIASDRNTLAGALEDLVSAYNSAADAINAQIGEQAGLLSGDFLVRHTQAQLRALAGYRSQGPISSLTDLGIEMDSTGKMSFSQATFDTLAESDLADAFNFLGTATTGLGGLAASFDEISDPISGLIKTQQDRYDEADSRLSSEMDALSERIELMQNGLSAKLQQADVLLAQLETQQSILTASLDSLSASLFGKNE